MKNGELRILRDGSHMYVLDGSFHRTDGPAIISANGIKQSYFIYGKRHRLDGPAVINGNMKYWYYNGHFIDNCYSQEEFEKLLKFKAFW